MLNIEDYSLRLMEEKDLLHVLEWRNSANIRANMFTDQIISLDDHLAWFERLQKKLEAAFNIFEYLGQPAGVVNFTDFDNKNNRWNWGIYLGKEDLPRGSGSIMGQLGLSYAFEHLDARKLCGECFAFNTSSIKFHQRMGFNQEGFFKKHVYKNGVYEDIIAFGLLKDDYIGRYVTNENY